MLASDIQAAIRALPRDGETLKKLLIAVQCYAADLHKLRDPDAGGVADAICDALTDYEAATEPAPELSERERREERRDWEASLDGYRRAA